MIAAVSEATGDGIARGDLTGLIVAVAVLGLAALVLTVQGCAQARHERRDLNDLRRNQNTRTALSRAARQDLHHATKDTR